MKIVTIIGARPQFIKAAAVSRAIAKHNARTSINEHKTLNEIIIHTGQHYDDEMSAIFFRELEIPEPKYHLHVGSGSHGAQTGKMLAAIEEVLLKEKPDWALIYGDTNSTLAGAIAAAKLCVPIAHVEAGMRSFNRRMPEEINRVVTDHLSTVLFCSSQASVENLAAEGIPSPVTPNASSIAPRVYLTGDVMADALAHAVKKTADHSKILTRLHIKPQQYILATIHRAENTDHRRRLNQIMSALSEIAKKQTVILPLHPRTKKRLEDQSLSFSSPRASLKIIDPVSYFDNIVLQKNARVILTDSGGMQKEAYWLKVPCVTLRDETEWVETVANGWNVLTGADEKKIIEAALNFKIPSAHPSLYGDGKAAEKILEALGVRS